MIATNTIYRRRLMPFHSIETDRNLNQTLDSEALVKLIQGRSERGFRILYNKYCGALYGVIIKFVRRTDVADDLMQDTFVKIWKHIDAFDAERGTLYTWMLNIARNQAIDYLRSASHRKQMLHVEIDSVSNQLDFTNTSDATSKAIEYKDFKKKAMQLDSKYAEVIDMIFFFGWTHEQTAELLKLPLGTVKTRSRKGLELLKLLYVR
jgi:RNA polymerase sigma factor (sigma-70 family)